MQENLNVLKNYIQIVIITLILSDSASVRCEADLKMLDLDCELIQKHQ